MPERDLPASEQSNRQLLETLLRSGKNAERLASIAVEDLRNSTRQELALTYPAYQRLMAGVELGRRVAEAASQYVKPVRLDSSAAAIEFCRNHFARLIAEALQEQFHIVTLNTKLGVIDTHRVTVGTLDASLIHPREVFRSAIKDAASSLIVAHNHPSGDPTPSKEDIAVTDRLTQAGELIGISVMDHIILARQGCISIRERQWS